MGIPNQNIENMKMKYPSLEYIERDDMGVFTGEVILNHVYDGVRMTGKFNINIMVPRGFPLALPTVKELSNRIDKAYPHQYTDGHLCLASDLDLKMHFSQNENISSFVDKYVIPYFYTYRFYENYGVYPYGERSHGTMGDLEYIKDLLNVKEWKQVFDCMVFVIRSTYRGHTMCPCGSGKRIRDCHGIILRQMMAAGLHDDCIQIMKELRAVYGKE